jgi:hypothetical protein
MAVLPAHTRIWLAPSRDEATRSGSCVVLVDPLDALYDVIVVDTPPSESYLAVTRSSRPTKYHSTASSLPAMQGSLRPWPSRQVKRGLNPGFGSRVFSLSW